MPRERSAPQSEVIRAIFLENSCSMLPIALVIVEDSEASATPLPVLCHFTVLCLFIAFPLPFHHHQNHHHHHQQQQRYHHHHHHHHYHHHHQHHHPTQLTKSAWPPSAAPTSAAAAARRSST